MLCKFTEIWNEPGGLFVARETVVFVVLSDNGRPAMSVTIRAGIMVGVEVAESDVE